MSASDDLATYVWYLDSVNRNKECKDPNNPTNDVTIPTHLSVQSLGASSFYLGSFELFKLTQYTIESIWQNLLFVEGIDLVIGDVSDLPLREFTIQINHTQYTASIPMLLNPIIDVDTVTSGATMPIFTTLYDHGLTSSILEAWRWNDPIRLISTNVTDTNITEFTSSNTSLTILNDNQFQLNLGAGAVTWTVNAQGNFGYLYAPSIASPVELANIVTQALATVLDESTGPIIITYDIDVGHFKLQVKQPNLGTVCYTGIPQCPDPGVCGSDATTNQDRVTVIIPQQNSLPFIMGFGLKDIDVPSVAPYLLEGQFGLQCFSHIAIPVGNYNPTTLTTELYMQWNRLWFDPECEEKVGDQQPFIFSNECGTCFTIPILYGLYSPDTFGETLAHDMNNADPLHRNYTVTWNSDSGTFVFTSDGPVFGLEFDQLSTTNNLPERLGFDRVPYRNQNSYESTNPFFTPINGCCGTTIPSTFLSFIYTPILKSAEGKINIHISKPRCHDFDSLTITNGIARISNSGAVARYAWGFQPNDVVRVRSQTGTTYEFRVTNVVSAFTFEVDIGSVTPANLTAGSTSCACLAGAALTNLLLARRPNNNQLLNRIIGYTDDIGDIMYTELPFISDTCVNLDHVTYILLDILEPIGDSRAEHFSEEKGNKARIFAKIILYPQFRIERLYPMNMYIPETKKIMYLKMRILNPDHSLYQLHGQEWSATLVFLYPQKSAQLICQ